MDMSKRSAWIKEVLANSVPHDHDLNSGLVSRVEALESLVVSYGADSPLNENTEEFIDKTSALMSEFNERVSGVEEGLASTSEHVAAVYKNVRMLAEFMERCLPFIQGMEEAFSSEEAEEGGDGEE